MVKKHVIDCDKDPVIWFDAWSVESHTKMGKLAWKPDEIELYLSEKQKIGHIEGNELRKELEGKPVLNACVLDYLMEHPNLIPDSWKGKYIYFWGTIFRDADGNLFVEFLCWGGFRWFWSDRWLGRGWGGDEPAASLASMPSGSREISASGSLPLGLLEKRVKELEDWKEKITQALQ